MRSYDWRMPEEKYRTVIDHLSDRIYAYLESYKLQGLREGISENIIKVTGNPIVDIINENLKFFDTGSKYLKNEILDLTEDNFVLVTCHRRENILNEYGVKLGSDYPYPIVDLSATRQRALTAFQKISKTTS